MIRAGPVKLMRDRWEARTMQALSTWATSQTPTTSAVGRGVTQKLLPLLFCHLERGANQSSASVNI